MPHREPARTAVGRARWLTPGAFALAIAALAGIATGPSPAAFQARSPAPLSAPPRPPEGGRRAAAAPPENDHDTVAHLDPALRAALGRATADARRDGVGIVVTSGWRSPAHQRRLFRDAVLRYGSQREARRWVAPPGASRHVSGDAIDVGPARAITWLSRHGARYGLCRTYRNEPWHYELRRDTATGGCPPMFADASHDPRMTP